MQTHNYVIKQKVGQGSFGQVLLVHKADNPSVFYAMKRINRNKLHKLYKSHEPFIEKEILNKFKQYPNNHCVSIDQTFSDEQYVYLILQYCQGGPLNKIYPQIRGENSSNLIVNIIAKIVIGLQQIHNAGVFHRDLKPSNILITKEGDLKIADFGTAYVSPGFLDSAANDKIQSIKKMMEEKKLQKTLENEQCDSPIFGNGNPEGRNRINTFNGSPLYMSPELLSQNVCGKQADLWALGCIIYEMITGKTPFHDINEGLVWKRIIEEKFQCKMNTSIPYANQIVSQLLQKNMTLRLGCTSQGYKKLKKHPFFSIIEWEKLQKQPLAELKQYVSQDLQKMSFKKKQKSIEQQKVLFSGVVNKKMFFGNYNERMLVLNSFPKLIYYDMDSGKLKGQIVLTKNTPVTLDGKYFTITNEKKTYYFKTSKAQEWAEMVKATIIQSFY